MTLVANPGSRPHLFVSPPAYAIIEPRDVLSPPAQALTSIDALWFPSSVGTPCLQGQLAARDEVWSAVSSRFHDHDVAWCALHGTYMSQKIDKRRRAARCSAVGKGDIGVADKAAITVWNRERAQSLGALAQDGGGGPRTRGKPPLAVADSELAACRVAHGIQTADSLRNSACHACQAV